MIMNRPTPVVAVAVAVVALVTVGACKKDPPAPVASDAPAPPAPAGPPPGSDGDNKRIEALDLAVKVDAELPTLERAEKTLADGRKVEAWIARTATPPVARKVVVHTVGAAADAKAPGGVVDMYYDDKGMLAFARAPDGMFIFRMESLALWLDADQKVKRGISPAVVKPRADALLADNRAALAAFGLR